METPTHAINWFEIPVSDFDRAKAFYSSIFDFAMPETQMGPNRMGFLLFEQGKGIGGTIIQGDGYIPSRTGSLVYLNAGPDLSTVLSRVAAAGGQIIVPKTEVAPGLGFYAFLIDTEGNRVALHSMS